MADQRFLSVFDIDGESVAMIGVLLEFYEAANARDTGIAIALNCGWATV